MTYRELLNNLKQGMMDRRTESWFHTQIETKGGMVTEYIRMNRDLVPFLEYLESMASMEEMHPDLQSGSMLFMIGGA